MKKTIVTSLALVAAMGAFAQGTVTFNNVVSGQVSTRVYAPTPGNESVQTVGNTAAQTAPGTQTYTGALLTGSGWTAQLWSVSGSVIPAGVLTPYGLIDASLQASATTTTFRTGGAAGVVQAPPGAAVLANVALDAASAVLQLRVFPTSFGTWAAAVTAFNENNPLAIIGASPMFVVNQIGGNVNTPPNLVGLQSFSLVSAPVPEPGTLALAGLGAASLLLFRRKK